METDPTRMCELLVGLGEVTVVGVDRSSPVELVVTIEPVAERPDCGGCGAAAWVKDRAEVALVDLPCFDSMTTLVVRKTRWWCPNRDCAVGSWTPELAQKGEAQLGSSGMGGRGRPVVKASRCWGQSRARSVRLHRQGPVGRPR